jgi:hypothetical protein
MKHWLILVCALGMGITANAQYNSPSIQAAETEPSVESTLEQRPVDPSTLNTTREYSSERLNVRKFDQERWRKITGNHEYNDPPKKKKSSTGTDGEHSESNQRDAGDDDDDAEYETDSLPAFNLGWLSPVFQYIFYGIIAAVIITILYQIFRNTSFKAKPKKPSTSTANTEDVTDINDLDTDSLLQQAHLAGNYKLAIRLYFLHLLKKLNENGTIVWAKDKTNRDYLSELFSKQFYFDEIRKLTLAYERVWYGEHTPTPETYEQLSSEFRSIDQKLKSTGTS